MLNEERNRALTQIGPGAPMGAVLRRHWLPIGAVSEFDGKNVRPARVLGEDLVLYKDLSGDFGLIERQCPHRRADLANGFVEAHGLRCSYHGWHFSGQGRCLAMPYEDIAAPELGFRDKVSIKAYPVRAHAGLLWAYMGDAPAPDVPNYEPFTWPHGFRQIVFAELPCNWAQCQENSIDPVHFEWAHANWSVRLRGETGPYSARHVKVAFEEFDHGLIYKRIREDTDEANDLWTVGRVALWPIGMFLGDHIEWRVPIDDTRTLSVTWYFQRMPQESEPFEQASVPHWYGPVKDENGAWITSHVMNQDFVAWAGQGAVADRSRERLGKSDEGILMMRRLLFKDIERVAKGEDPKAVVRGGGIIALPVVERERHTESRTRAEMLAHPLMRRNFLRYPYQAGQPETVRAALWAAAGVREADLSP